MDFCLLDVQWFAPTQQCLPCSHFDKQQHDSFYQGGITEICGVFILSLYQYIIFRVPAKKLKIQFNVQLDPLDYNQITEYHLWPNHDWLQARNSSLHEAIEVEMFINRGWLDWATKEEKKIIRSVGETGRLRKKAPSSW